MSFNEVAIRVEHLGKRYEIYDAPRDRLKQFLLPPMQKLIGKSPKQYFKEFWAIQEVSFEVKKGEAFGIIGRNGSGKSTLLQLITGTLSPTVGTVWTQGRVAALLELGSGFNPDFTGRENVFLNGILLGMTHEEVSARFDDIAAFADIGEYIDQPVKTYSSGMLVRLAFSVQVHVQPDILIVDEALAVGDALFQKRCYEQIQKLISDGLTLIFVSHDQETVRTLTRRALLLKQGRMLSCGVSSNVLLEYRKLLHDEESSYFFSIVDKVKEKKEKSVAHHSAQNNYDMKSHSKQSGNDDEAHERAAQLSFGEGGIKIVKVQIADVDGNSCAIFYPGDIIKIKVECISEINTDKLNIAVRIRNKEGLKLYSWGTLNQDMQILAGIKGGPVFWRRQVHAGEHFEVSLACECTLGSNLYEVQASVSYEDRPDYTAQRMLHWMDEAAFFQVLVKQNEYFFGGLYDLRMSARW